VIVTLQASVDAQTFSNDYLFLSMFQFRVAMEFSTPEEVANSFSCAVCLEEFTEPKALQCLHTYCKECLVKLVRKEGSDHVITCPACREDTKVSMFYMASKQALVCYSTSNEAVSVLVFLLPLCFSCCSTQEPDLEAM